MDNTDEIEKLKEQLKDMEEAAKYWKKRYEDFYEKVDINIKVIDKKIDWIKVDYDLMFYTLNSIVYLYIESNEDLYKIRQLAVDCILQLDTNKKERENE